MLSLTNGYLNKEGYCHNGDCQVFPVMWGEFGSALTDPRDVQVRSSEVCRPVVAAKSECSQCANSCCAVQYYTDLVAYMANTGAGSDGQHNAINSWFWWCYPANGGGTGGIVDSDWLTIDWTKVRVFCSESLHDTVHNDCPSHTLHHVCADRLPNPDRFEALVLAMSGTSTSVVCAVVGLRDSAVLITFYLSAVSRCPETEEPIM